VTPFAGYYGACNEELMRLELVLRGPISVSFEVYPDFMNYKSGIYHYTGLGKFSPFEVRTGTIRTLIP
jgi:cathepsin C